MLVITRIPTHRNDVSKIGRRELRGILSRVCDAFDGYTLEGPFQGAWIAAVGVATVIVEMASKRAVIKALFNVSQAMFWVGVATIGYHYLGGVPLRASSTVNYPAFIAALAAFAFLHSAALAGVISRSAG